MADDTDISTLRRILGTCRTIAVVGLSANWYRPSYFAAKYMQDHGYTVIPVNPAYPEVLGQKCYSTLADIPVSKDVTAHSIIAIDGDDKPPKGDDGVVECLMTREGSLFRVTARPAAKAP